MKDPKEPEPGLNRKLPQYPLEQALPGAAPNRRTKFQLVPFGFREVQW